MRLHGVVTITTSVSGALGGREGGREGCVYVCRCGCESDEGDVMPLHGVVTITASVSPPLSFSSSLPCFNPDFLFLVSFN